VIIMKLCHQKPERSFHIGGRQFPVCARCTGIWLGIPIAFILLYVFGFRSSIVMLLIIPMIIDGGTQYLGYRESTNTLRFVTGILFAVGWIVGLQTVFPY